MSLPTDADYQEAIQSPRQVFHDPELQGGQPEIMSAALPLPKARSGNFAVAFRMDCGQRSWAVKCFTRALHPDLQARYTEISKHLEATRLPYTVGFTFQPQGIRVRSEWLPILKMEWIHGDSLVKHIEQNLRSPAALINLATRWIEMVRALQQARISHGDLQHGNVLVIGGGLRLIDYDGMFVPALAGRPSHEKGHENYQHPLRETDFGPGLDNFSAWVILLSILAVAHEPQLWAKFRGGDECLLFRKRDFLEPDRSVLIQALLNSREQRIQSLTSLFRTLIYLPPHQVPSLDGQFIPSAPATPQVASNTNASWISDHLPREAPRASTAATAISDAPPEASWVLDFIEPATQARPSFAQRAHLERLTAALTFLLGAFVLFGVLRGFFPSVVLASFPILLLGNAALWFVRYRTDATVKLRGERISQLKQVEHEFAEFEAKLRAFADEQRRSNADGANEHAALRKAQQATEKRLATELEIPRRECRREMGGLRAQRADLDQQQLVALQKIQGGSGARLARVGQQIAGIAQAESSELARELNSLQQQHLSSALRTASLDRAEIPGIKDGLKAKLKAHGFNCAADVERIAYVKVEGIGEKKTAALLAWRSAIEHRARASVPRALPAAQSAAIHSKYRAQLAALEAERAAVQQQNSDEISAVQSQVRQEQDALVARENAIGDTLRRAESTIQSLFAPELAKCAEDAAAVVSAVQKRNDEIDRRAQETRKASFSINWRREKVRREVAAFDSVRFPKYLRRIVPPLVAVATAALVAVSVSYHFVALAMPNTPAATTTSEVPRAAPPSKDQLLLQKCDGGNGAACAELGHLYDDGKSVPRDHARAVEQFQKACTAGDVSGCVERGIEHERVAGVGDLERAEALYRRACDDKNPRGCFRLGKMHDLGKGIAKDQKRAVDLYRMACDGGDASGCGNLGLKYGAGEGVAKDEKRAAELFRKACDAGEAGGCNNLGVSYAFARGVPKDEKRAVELYSKACESGLAMACRSLGYKYDAGEGVVKDAARAGEFYRRGCDGADPESCSNLGTHYASGKGAPLDNAKANELFRRACDAGFGRACSFLAARMKNAPDAKALYARACKAGDKEACRHQ
jgi:TPR repeat protein